MKPGNVARATEPIHDMILLSETLYNVMNTTIIEIKAANALGSLTASSFTPIIFMKNAMFQVKNGGLVFHKSGSPSYITTNGFPDLTISIALIAFLDSSH